MSRPQPSTGGQHAARLPLRCKRCGASFEACACPDAAVIGVVP